MLDANDPKLTAYVLNELDDESRAEIEQQIADSKDLQLAVEEIRQTVGLITKSLQREPTESLTSQQRETVAGDAAGSSSSLITGRKKEMPTSQRNDRQRHVSIVAAASLMLLLLSAAAIWSISNSEPQHVIVSSQQDTAADGLPVRELEIEEYEDLVVDNSSSGHSVLGELYGSNAPETLDKMVLDQYAPIQVELSDFGEQTAPKADLLSPLGTVSGTGISGRGAAVPASNDTRQFTDRVARDPRELGVKGSLARQIEFEAGEGRFLELIEDGREVIAAKVRTEVESALTDARSRNGVDAEGAEADLDLVLEMVERAVDLDAATRIDLRKRLEEAKREASVLAVSQSERRAKFEETKYEGLERQRPDSGGENRQGTVTKSGEQRGKDSKPIVPRTWRRVKATPNTSRLMVGDQDELPFEGMQANVVIDGFRARVLLDCYFYNNHDRRLEGTFKLRLPDEASLYYFAFGQTAFEYRPMVDQLASKGFIPADVLRSSGTGPGEILKSRGESWGDVKEARVVTKAKAAHAYSEVVRRRVDPALVEWAGAGVFNARVFPLMPNKLHRIVIGYDVNLRQVGQDLVYQLDLPEDLRQCSIDLNVAALPGADASIEPQAKPFTSAGRAYYHFDNLVERSVSVRVRNSGAMILMGNDGQTGDYFATRITPELPAGEVNTNSDSAIFLIDTSLSSNPDKFNVWLQLLEATLKNNRESLKQFGVLFFDVDSHWWRSGFEKNTPENVAELMKHCQSLSLEGATDLGQALDEAVSPEWNVRGESNVKRPDVFLLSDGAVTWGESSPHLLAKKLDNGWKGTLFAYRTGLSGTASGLLEHLVRNSGGSVFTIVNEDEIARASTAHRSRPWQLIDATVTGGSDILLAGRNRSIFPGQSLLLVGRGTPAGEVVLKLKRGDELKTIRMPTDRVVKSELAPRLFGQIVVGQLEGLASATEDVAAHYARHFRVTGETCSLLMLESEADYQRYDIKPKDDQFVVKSVAAAELIERKLDEFRSRLENPKEEMIAWLRKLERTPGMRFELPTVLELALDKMPRRSFEIEIPRLRCKSHDAAELSKKYFNQLQAERLDYDAISAEANRRLEKFGGDDALRALSNLVESQPGDLVLARDVAFSAIEWGHAGQAIELLRRVARSRPYQPQNYQAIGRCLSDIGHADLALVFYEIAWNGVWSDDYPDFNRIVGVEYLHLLRRIDDGDLISSVSEFAKARMSSLESSLAIGEPDLIVTMLWNTDRTDVDLHVLEPSGQECYYKNPNLNGGGKLTQDATQGFGPEMYLLPEGQSGKYQIKAKYYSGDNNRTQLRTKVYLTVYEGFGVKHEKVSRRTVLLDGADQKLDVMSVRLDKP